MSSARHPPGPAGAAAGSRARAGPGRPGAATGQPARGGWHWPEWLAECAGTAALLLGGLSAICLDFGPRSPVAPAVPSHSLRLLFTGLMFAGSGSLVAVSPLGRLSGAHLNPAVTAGFWLQRHVHPRDLAGYAAGQFSGAVAGVALAWAAWRGTLASAAVGFARTHPGGGLGPVAAAGVETVMTAALIFTIFAFVSSPRTARWTPLAVWVVVAVLVWQGAPYTGTSLNPARTLAPDLLSGRYPALWAYFAGPLAGALLASAVWAAVRGRRTLTAKLFHDPRYRSVLRTELPALPVRRRPSGQRP